MYVIKHCFICRPSDFTVSEDAVIKPRTVATLAMSARRYNHSAGSHPRNVIAKRVLFFKVSDSSAAELFFEEIFELGFEGEDPLFDLRHHFYTRSGDSTLDRLSHAVSVAEVLNTIAELEQPNSQHLTQVLIILHCIKISVCLIY
jgi:hypothetical protein